MEHGAHSRGHLRTVRYDPDQPFDERLEDFMATRRFMPDDPSTIDHEHPDWDVFNSGLAASRRLRFHIIAATMFTIMLIVWLLVWLTW